MANCPVKVWSFESGTATDLVTYCKYFKGMRAVWDWNDARSRRELIMAIDGEAMRMMQDIEFWATGQTFDDMIGLFEGHFITQAKAKLAQQEFRMASQMPDKLVLQFHSRVCTLFTQAYPAMATEGNRLAQLLCGTFIGGLESRKITEYVFDGQPDTYQGCLTREQEDLASLSALRKRKARGVGKGAYTP
jgi:hypothetical protein